MARTRPIIVPQGTLFEGPHVLDDDLGRYLRDVLRLRVGAKVWATDGAGRCAEGIVDKIERRAVTVVFGPCRIEPPPRGPSISLIQAVGKNEKMDAVIRHTVELGVRRIRPVVTERTVNRREARSRWLQIAEDALRVSGRVWRPTIDPVRSLPSVLNDVRSGAGFVLALNAPSSLAGRLALLGSRASVELLVGPEGGLSPDEVTRAQQSGFLPSHMGSHALRTETAGCAVVAVAMALLDGWTLDP
ncbi:MAG: RsmE family RNA methyltransferase [Myxococcota bacterium]